MYNRLCAGNLNAYRIISCSDCCMGICKRRFLCIINTEWSEFRTLYAVAYTQLFAKETIREWRSNLIVKQEEDGLRIEYGGKEKEDTREDSKNAVLQNEKQSENKENEKITANQKKTIDYSVPALSLIHIYTDCPDWQQQIPSYKKGYRK